MPVPEIVALAVGVTDSVIVDVAVPLLLLLVDGNAPIVTEEVRDKVGVLEKL